MVTFGMQENLTPNLLFIDGLTRCGKSIFSPLIGTFEETEQIRFFNLIEQIIPAIEVNAINVDLAKSLIRTQLNEFVYDMKLSRNANFRPNDQTSVYNHPHADEYEARLRKDEGDNIIEEIRQSNSVVPIMLHDAMASIESYLRLDLTFKLIEIYRHPIDLIQSQYKRGWGNRFGYDPRSFTLTTTKNGSLYPWYAIGYESEWNSFSELERTVWMTVTLLDKSIKNHRALADSRNFLTVKFEDLVTTPIPVISYVSDFIGKRPTEHTWNTLKASNIPRQLDQKLRSKTFDLFSREIRNELRTPLVQLVADYESNCFGVPHYL
jgi:hypothetical protein